MAIELPALPYLRNALEPHLSAAALDEHHGSHHRGHVEATNRLLEGSGLEGLALEEIVRRARGRLADEAAQAWSHGFYWTCLSPCGGGDPAGPLAERLARACLEDGRVRRATVRIEKPGALNAVAAPGCEIVLAR